MNTDELVTAYTTNDRILADIIANELRDEGIDAVVDGTEQAGFTGVIDVQVHVRAADAERAAAIIREHEQAKVAEIEAEDESQ